MTPHTHSKYVEGCYRCELSRDEVDDERSLDEAERVRAAAEAIRHAGASKAWRERVAQQAIEASGYPAQVALLKEDVEVWQTEVARLRAENERLRDYLGQPTHEWLDLLKEVDLLKEEVAVQERFSARVRASRDDHKRAADAAEAEVARLRVETVLTLSAEVARLRAELERALDALRPVFKWASTFPSFRATPWHDEAAAVLAAHDREYPCD